MKRIQRMQARKTPEDSRLCGAFQSKEPTTAVLPIDSFSCLLLLLLLLQLLAGAAHLIGEVDCALL